MVWCARRYKIIYVFGLLIPNILDLLPLYAYYVQSGLAPICKVFAAWRGITLYDGLATYDDTYGYNQYGYWKGERRLFVV